MVRARFIAVSPSEQRELRGRLCRAVQEWTAAGRRVALLVPDLNSAARIDEALWTFDDESFVPHSILAHDSSPLDRAVIIPGAPARFRADVFVNLSPDPLPAAALEASGDEVEIVEFVRSADSDSRDTARRKWGRYKELGLEPVQDRL